MGLKLFESQEFLLQLFALVPKRTKVQKRLKHCLHLSIYNYYNFIILRHIENMESKILISKKCVFFTRSLPVELALRTMLDRVMECFAQNAKKRQKYQKKAKAKLAKQAKSTKNDKKKPKRQKNAKKAKNARNVKIAEIAKIARMAKAAKIAEIADIAETEIVRFLETLEIWVFLEKKMGFLKTSLIFVQKLYRWQNHCIKWLYCSKMSPP